MDLVIRPGHRYHGGGSKKLIDLTRAYYEGEAGPIEILPGNEELWNILQYMDTQWRVGMGGAYGLDYAVVDGRACARNIPLDTVYAMKVHAYERTALDLLNKHTGKERCDDKKREFCKYQYGDLFEWTCKNCKEINKTSEA